MNEKCTAEIDAVKMAVNEVVSSVVAAIDGYSALQVASKNERKFYYNDLEPATPAKKRKSTSTIETLPITCPVCAVVCSQERVYWNHFPSKDALFLCPECIQTYGKIYPIKTTLIIAPATICHQWYEELKRHISADVKIDMYRGVLYDGYKHPEYLATQDIVVCSFETLRSEINFMGARPRRG
ncbi:unnamed protein product [Gongylonema pulchrum]|uniref:SNF2_N domain-containing protein n=1 Tax=Gongylonema pulchrum TaxID=637853 RepID=A0A183E177_9BILA|nr:unnamed protein product [Gongylonema pulchrum]